MEGSHSITLISENGLLKVLKTECHVSQGFDPTKGTPDCDIIKFSAIWDTGATNSVITPRLVKACGLEPVGVVNVRTVHGTRQSNRYIVNVTTLPNNFMFSEVLVTEGDLTPGEDLLIGMDIITTGDFSITNKNGITCFSFRVPSQHHIDYVDDIIIVRQKLKF